MGKIFICKSSLEGGVALEEEEEEEE